MLMILEKQRKNFDPHAFLIIILASVACVLLLTISGIMASDFSQDFVMQVFMGSEFEVESSQLALQKTHDQTIKSFARSMVDDHTVIKDNLIAVVESTSDVTVILPTTKLDRQHRQILHALREKSGVDFDKLYVKDQVRTDSETIAEFQFYLKNGPSQALRVLAQRTLPILLTHLEAVRQIRASMEG